MADWTLTASHPSSLRAQNSNNYSNDNINWLLCGAVWLTAALLHLSSHFIPDRQASSSDCKDKGYKLRGRGYDPVCAHGGQRTTSAMPLLGHCPPRIFEAGSLSVLELRTTQKAPGIFLSLPYQSWDYKGPSLPTSLSWFLGIKLSESLCLQGKCFTISVPNPVPDPGLCAIQIIIQSGMQIQFLPLWDPHPASFGLPGPSSFPCLFYLFLLL